VIHVKIFLKSVFVVAVLFAVASAALWAIEPVSTKPIVLGHSGDQPMAKGDPDAPLSLIVDDGGAENSIGDNGQFMWFNRFTPDPADFPIEINQIDVMFGSTEVNVGDAIELFVYEDTDGDGDPGTGANLLATYNDTVQFNDMFSFSTYALVPPVILNGPGGDILIGVVNRYSFEGFADFPAAIDQDISQERSWAASWLAGDVPANPTLPADEQWGTIDSFGFPGNWTVRAFGETNVPVELQSFEIE
jgi:hypothetical protein